MAKAKFVIKIFSCVKFFINRMLIIVIMLSRILRISVIIRRMVITRFEIIVDSKTCEISVKFILNSKGENDGLI